MDRKDVYKAIDSERDYQDVIWNSTTTAGDLHSFEEWFTYITDYVLEAQHKLSRSNQDDGYEFSRHSMRKVAAMAVRALEQHGAEQREGFER